MHERLPAEGKCAEPDDPMEFTAAAFPGDTTDSMAECFVEEYVIQGFPDEAILKLFANPFFAGTHRVWRERGEAWVRELIAGVRERFGGVRFRTTVAGGTAEPFDKLRAKEAPHA